MFDFTLLTSSLILVCSVAVILWLVSIVIHDVSIVDTFWSLMIMLAGLGYYYFGTGMTLDAFDERQLVVVALLVIWSLRLSAHIAIRNRGHEEDARYQEIRANNEPNFAFKSLYIVFLLQAILALIVSLPLLSVVNSSTPVGMLDYIALALWCFGMFFEVVGDYQLARFKSNKSNKGKVLNTGLWRYTRHPNYFGEFCIWWSFFLFALASGYAWSIISPVLMTLLLLKVSGVSLLEKSIGERRPGYQDYRETTNAFFPWFPAVSKEVK